MRLPRLLPLLLLFPTLLAAQSTTRYVNPSPHAPDLITQVNQLFADCHYLCEVHIPAGNYKVDKGTILLNHPSQSLTGDGPGLTQITYAGPNFLDWRWNQGTYSYAGAGQVAGFAVTCTSPTAKCITAGSTLGALFQDLAVFGPGGIVNQGPAGTAEGFVFQNTFNWMEHWTLRRIFIGGFDVNMHFMNPAPGGTESFGYGTVDGVVTSQGGGTRGVVIEPSAYVYNFLSWRYSFNLNFARPPKPNLIFEIHGALRGVDFQVTGENAGVPFTFAHMTCGGNVQVDGSYRVFGMPNVIVDPCPGKPVTNGIPPFWIGKLMDPPNLTAGAGTVANWAGLGETYSVIPTAMGSVDYPTGAMTGYMYGSKDGASSPLLTYDERSKLCLQTHSGYAPINNVSPVWCSDGGGNTMQNGEVSASSFAVHGVKGFTGTVDSARCAPVFHVDAGIITSVTCSESHPGK